MIGEGAEVCNSLMHRLLWTSATFSWQACCCNLLPRRRSIDAADTRCTSTMLPRFKVNDCAREAIAALCTFRIASPDADGRIQVAYATIQTRDGEAVGFRSGVEICSESRNYLGALPFPLSLNVLAF